MKKNVFILLAALTLGINAYAITPQKYCESLAATSCEVLNIETIRDPTATTGLPIGWDVKYCRDRVLFNRYFVKAPNNACTAVSYDSKKQCIYVENISRNMNDNVYVSGNTTNSVHVSIDGSLCSKTYSTNGSDVKNVLP